jgi:hypothetical protein
MFVIGVATATVLCIVTRMQPMCLSEYGLAARLAKTIRPRLKLCSSIMDCTDNLTISSVGE